MREVPGRPVRQMPTVAKSAKSSDSAAPAKATAPRLSATGVGSANSRCSTIAVASTPTENSAMRLVQRAKNDGPRGGGGLMALAPCSCPARRSATVVPVVAELICAARPLSRRASSHRAARRIAENRTKKRDIGHRIDPEEARRRCARPQG